MKVYRHGDLLIVPVNKKRKDKVKKSETNCILEGEVTNHHHRADKNASVSIAVLEPTQTTDYYRGVIEVPVRKKTDITHEEHDTITLDPGKYETFVQREYDPIQERRVID
jgi:hypothetical protein